MMNFFLFTILDFSQIIQATYSIKKIEKIPLDFTICKHLFFRDNKYFCLFNYSYPRK